jgi:hypothetical protein
MADFIPHFVPNWFQLGTIAHMADSKTEPLRRGHLVHVQPKKPPFHNLQSEFLQFRGRIQRKHGVWDPMPELTINSHCVHSRLGSNTFTMGNPMPESTLTLCQSRLYPPVSDCGFGLCLREDRTGLTVKDLRNKMIRRGGWQGLSLCRQVIHILYYFLQQLRVNHIIHNGSISKHPVTCYKFERFGDDMKRVRR